MISRPFPAPSMSSPFCVQVKVPPMLLSFEFCRPYISTESLTLSPEETVTPRIEGSMREISPGEPAMVDVAAL